jgi:hypothetical protein
MRKLTKQLFAVAVLFVACGNASYAAFPVMSKPAQHAVVSVSNTNETVVTEVAPAVAAEESAAAPQPEMGSMGGANKSQLIAALLCFFLGGLGIHRFYLGYIAIGILQILTAGGFFGIWVFIDFIRILLGTLKPKHGKYAKM